MAKIAFILLCHKDPEAIIKQAQSLTAAGDCMAIHFDARAPQADFERIRAALADNPNVTFARRVKCGWGAWSLVQATLNAVEAALGQFPRATHVYMVSGDCMAIKSARYMHALLDAREADYIESVDFFTSGWIKTGWKEERLIYRHPFNERTQKRRFYALFELQKRLGLKRRIPADLEVMIGSQWWCLRRRTVEAILAFVAERPDVVRFFRGTWIPDETFFQTLVRHLVPEPEIESRTLTFLMFSDYGMPVTFYNDHYDLLLAQDFLFARKISPDALDLKRRLGVLFSSGRVQFEISGEGRSLYQFLTEKGRDGHRFAPRFWETESSLGRERELLIVVSKKWHVAKRLIGRIRAATGLACIDYLFNEESCTLPDLGGLQSTMDKRHRHHRALMRMLYDVYGCQRLVICLDPGNLDLIEDFCRDRATTRLLQIDCLLSDEFLAGHATRIGLAGERTSETALARLVPTIRNDILHECDRLRDAQLPGHLYLREQDPRELQAQALAQFLSVSPGVAREIVSDTQLYSD